MTNQARDPADGDDIDVSIEVFHEGLFTSLLARVESVDYARQTVNAQPVVRRRFVDGRGEAAHERLPVVVGAPVMFPGAGGCGIRFPIPTGSTVLLVCLSHSIDRWLLVGREVDAGDGRKHTLNDVVAFPAGHAYGGPAKPQVKWLEDAMVLYGNKKLVAQADEVIVRGGKAVVDSPDVRMGGDAATERVAWHSAVADLKAIFLAWTPVAMDGGAALKTALADWHPTGATRTKAL